MCAGDSDASKLLNELDVLIAKLQVVMNSMCEGIHEEVCVGPCIVFVSRLAASLTGASFGQAE